jgi:hypothetical protein
VSGQPHTPAALPLGKEPWYPLAKRLGGTQCQSGHFELLHVERQADGMVKKQLYFSNFSMPYCNAANMARFISGFHHDVHKTCALLEYYAALCGNCGKQLPHSAA